MQGAYERGIPPILPQGGPSVSRRASGIRLPDRAQRRCLHRARPGGANQRRPDSLRRFFRPAGATDTPAIVCYAPFGKHPHIDLKNVFAGSDIPFDRLSPETPFEVFDPVRWAREGLAISIVDAMRN